jgi:hypothetical protein
VKVYNNIIQTQLSVPVRSERERERKREREREREREKVYFFNKLHYQSS